MYIFIKLKKYLEIAGKAAHGEGGGSAKKSNKGVLST